MFTSWEKVDKKYNSKLDNPRNAIKIGDKPIQNSCSNSPSEAIASPAISS